MSDMLGEAIVDAKSLRAAALKNAENIVIEKYSTEVRNTLETILEQEEEMAPAPEMGAEMAEAPPLEAPLDETPAPTDEEIFEGDDVPLAATSNLSQMDGENLSGFPTEGEEVEVTLDLGALQEAVKALGEELDEEIEITEEDLANILSEEDEDL